ncbi:MAG: hypothetical protein AB7F38_00010 [Piscinibacter sp.]
MPVLHPRIAGGLVALALGLALTLAAVVTLALVGVRDKTLVLIATGSIPAVAGLILAGWNKPTLFLASAQSTWQLLNKRLATWQQRALLLASVALSLPWLLVRVVGETFETSSISEYARSAYYPLLNTLITVSSWGYEPQWYEWLLLLGLLCAVLALFWSGLIEPIAAWVRRGKQ